MDVLVDNTVLSNFAVIHDEVLFSRIVGGTLFAPQKVLDELSVGESRHAIPQRDWS